MEIPKNFPEELCRFIVDNKADLEPWSAIKTIFLRQEYLIYECSYNRLFIAVDPYTNLVFSHWKDTSFWVAFDFEGNYYAKTWMYYLPWVYQQIGKTVGFFLQKSWPEVNGEFEHANYWYLNKISNGGCINLHNTLHIFRTIFSPAL